MELLRAEIATATGEMGREHQILAATVLIAGNQSGPLVEEAHGFKHLAEDTVPADLNSTFWVASCTKLMTTVAALQIVERGLVSLDEDITRVLHEWKDVAVLTGFDESGRPITGPAQNKMTFRQLLTHSSGMVYDALSPELQKYRQYQGLPPIAPRTGQTLAEATLGPLLYEPGEGWCYSCSIDWAGVVVSNASDNVIRYVHCSQGGASRWMRNTGRLHVQEHLESLGMTAVTFHLNDRPDIRSNLVEMLARDETGQLQVSSTSIEPHTFKYDAGGDGLYLKPTDYAKLLASLLRNDEVLLKKETVDLMFTPQLRDPKWLTAFIKATPYPMHYTLLHALPKEIDWNWGLGGLLNMEDIPGKRKKETICWTGFPNLFWWIDRGSNVYGMYATQIAPFGDVPATDVFSHFEDALYKELNYPKTT
ncbi:hypothetical protein D9758_014599 [Tetrapyrgos nigripes]|uniref:Beta-lactamase-related domain-containing protein n=1 Tax=Tetrapyrgos nigripes TaxID=182062 RepID=A0A8H5FCQ6_9AGAR|nr:hypothetical protein D9758_014599 [Tetrapyrgos nigripes]